MESALDFELISIVYVDHGDVEEVGAGEAKAMVTICLGEFCSK
jgi:hypothetical protein